VFRDVTDRRRREHALRDCLTYCENIVRTLREPFLVLDKRLRVKSANRAFYETFQVSPKETENRSVFELGNHQWDIPKLRTLLEEILPNNHSFRDFEVEHDFPTIGRRSILLNANQIRRDSDGEELILLAMDDITERRRQEEALRTSERSYRRLFESARDGILLLDARTGKIVDANPFMKEMLDYTKEELLGRELWEIGVFQDIEASRAAFRDLQDRGYIRYEDLPLQSKSGRQAEVEFVSNLYTVDHTPVIQCNVRDITARRQLEKAKVQAETLADTNRRKDEFLAMLSHELRNPLSAIMNASHLLSIDSETETPIQQEARGIIERQVAHLAHLVDDLLEVSRISTGRVRLYPEHVDMRGIVARAVETMSPLFHQHRHELTVTQPTEPIWLYADPVRLEQVVENLLANAAKYTNEGGQVWLTLQQQGNDAVLSVRDCGVGIAPEILPRIFDLFTQAERSLDRSQGGLGIGLTLVKRLVEMHGGEVDVFSQLGVGSEFLVRLPLRSPLALQPRSTPAETVEKPTHSLRVLVVDDNLDQAQSAALLLRASGHEVRVAFSGTTALEVALEFQPNVVLLDIGLPEMDGYEVAQHLRQNPQTKHVCLVALTGYGQDTDRQRSAAVGFDAHLVKPVDPRKLEGILSNVGRTDKENTPL
jgi:PAS domain S-box-containing protein